MFGKLIWNWDNSKEYADGWIKLLKVDKMITFTHSAQNVSYNENGGIVSDIKCL